MSRFIVSFCYFNQTFHCAVHGNWTDPTYFQKYCSTRQILVCGDEDFCSFPVRKAQHIIHYDLPQSLPTFLKRFESVFDTCEKLLNRNLMFRSVHGNVRSIGKLLVSSYLRFDSAVYASSPDIFHFLSKRKPDFKQIIDVSNNTFFSQVKNKC